MLADIYVYFGITPYYRYLCNYLFIILDRTIILSVQSQIMADENIKQKVQAIRLYSVTQNAAEVHRRLSEEFGDVALNSTTILKINKQFDETGSILPKKSP